MVSTSLHNKSDISCIDPQHLQHLPTMAFGFGSSSSSSSSTATTPALPDGAPPAPTREERKKCWTARDAYFGCLDRNNIIVPGEESKGPDGAETKVGLCHGEQDAYSKDCAKAWVSHQRFITTLSDADQYDYFNKRRVLEARQRKTLQAAADQGVKVPEYKR